MVALHGSIEASHPTCDGVAYYTDSSGNTHGFLYNGSTWTTLDDPNAAYGTSAQGIFGTNIVGYYTDSSGDTHGFLYNCSTWTTLNDPNADALYGTSAQGISGTNIVGYYTDSSGNAHGFLYNGSTWTTLDDPNTVTGTSALGISATTIVGYYLDSSGNAKGFVAVPVAQPSIVLGANFGVRTNRFGFNMSGSSNQLIVVQAATNLSNSVWTPVSTNTLTDGSSYFSDANWTNYPTRYYRLSAP